MFVRGIVVLEILGESSRSADHFETGGFVGDRYRVIACMGRQLVSHGHGIIETSESDVRPPAGRGFQGESDFVEAIFGAFGAPKLDWDAVVHGPPPLANNFNAGHQISRLGRLQPETAIGRNLLSPKSGRPAR